MASGDVLPPASVMWAQREDVLYVTINLPDCKEEKMDLNNERLHFRAEGESPSRLFENVLEFHGEVVPQESKLVVLPRNVPMVIKKKIPGYWPRLLKSKTKVHWLKTDFNKWKDEGESEEEDKGEKKPNDFNLNEMMSQMGNFGGGGGPGMGMEGADEEESEDSDDEKLPDLE